VIEISKRQRPWSSSYLNWISRIKICPVIHENHDEILSGAYSYEIRQIIPVEITTPHIDRERSGTVLCDFCERTVSFSPKNDK